MSNMSMEERNSGTYNSSPNQSESSFDADEDFDTDEDVETCESGAQLQSFTVDEKKCRRAIAEMLIIDGLPFSTVENEGFKEFTEACQPNFVIPSWSAVARDCLRIYVEEKAKLKAQMKKSVSRVCLTTETWTSVHQIDYMCLTARYVDEDWKLQKKVINFIPIADLSGVDIGRAIEQCLIDWGLQDIMTITVDDASGNDLAIDYLVGKMVKRGDRCIVKGKWTHVRCVAQTMNLIVQDGLKDFETSITRVREAIRWVIVSPGGLERFKKFAREENITCQKSLVLDVPTCWDSTYFMLSVACEYESAFKSYFHDDKEFSLENEVPESKDWENVRRLGGFLRLFYEITVRVSGTKSITSETYLDIIRYVDIVLNRCMLSDDEELRNMAKSMSLKFKKYWGDIKKFNLLVFIASLFDPRTKLDYLKLTLRDMYGNDIGDSVCQLCEDALREIFNDYKRIRSDEHAKKVSPSSKTVDVETASSNAFSLFASFDDICRALRERNMAEVKRRKIKSSVTGDSKTELDRYLTEEFEGDDSWFESPDFTVLDWWKKRSPVFPILSIIARDILAIPISTFSSESAFSTEGGVLDSFRSSLPFKTVEALICCQDWIRSNSVGYKCNVEENIEDLDMFEEEMRNVPMEE